MKYNMYHSSQPPLLERKNTHRPKKGRVMQGQRVFASFKYKTEQEGFNQRSHEFLGFLITVAGLGNKTNKQTSKTKHVI